MGTTEDILTQLKRDAFSGDLSKASKADLERYAGALCHSQAFSVFGERQFQQVCESVRIHLLRAHIDSLQRHITDLNAKNTKIQKWVIVLAVAALISTLFQTICTSIQTYIAVDTRQIMKSTPQQTAQPQLPQATSASSGTYGQGQKKSP